MATSKLKQRLHPAIYTCTNMHSSFPLEELCLRVLSIIRLRQSGIVALHLLCKTWVSIEELEVLDEFKTVCSSNLGLGDCSLIVPLSFSMAQARKSVS